MILPFPRRRVKLHKGVIISVIVGSLSRKISAIIQKRLKKEKKAKRKLQEALEYESKRREQVEQTLKQPSPSDSMRSLNGQTLHL